MAAFVERVKRAPQGTPPVAVGLFALLAVESGVLVGSASMLGSHYAIEPQGGEIHRVARMVDQAIPPGAEPIPVREPERLADANVGLDIPANAGLLIDVMIRRSRAGRWRYSSSARSRS